ncbi:hypothetical protein LOD99_10950 [Oopsacas minuta]|uniref:Uncharacterized protein n=1 Tax=Oopsacas minuta TaxID=111878 RepID=A0AAV7KCW1_9METZ|nr:hypothetical protein LOD99_10950 [Oopsacas minuta]
MHHHLIHQTGRTQHAAISITPPLPIPSTWEYKPPPIFIHQTGNINTASILQQLLEYGLTFQTPQDDHPNPFLTSFKGILELDNNSPPLTHYQIPKYEQRTYSRYNQLLKNLKANLKKGEPPNSISRQRPGTTNNEDLHGYEGVSTLPGQDSHERPPHYVYERHLQTEACTVPSKPTHTTL